MTTNKQKKVLAIVTNVGLYQDKTRRTGLWFGELSHFYDVLTDGGVQVDIASPMGGTSPIDPRSLKRFALDRRIMERLQDPGFMALLDITQSINSIDPQEYDAIFFTGGHGVMWDFVCNAKLQEITRTIYERGGVVSSVCHGYCGLLNIKLSDERRLIEGRRITGYSWMEEIFAGVTKHVPFNAEKVCKVHGGRYSKSWIPFLSHVVVDGNLVTGQNPFSTRATAKAVLKKIQ